MWSPLFSVRKKSRHVISLLVISFLWAFCFFADGDSEADKTLSDGNKSENSLKKVISSEKDESWLYHLCPRFQRHPNHRPIQWNPAPQDAVFFIKTSCQTQLSAREACAVESVIHHHPNRTVILFAASPTVNHTHPVMQILMKMKNFQVSWLDLQEVFREEPLRSWHQERSWMLSGDRTPAVVNDASRAEILHRYGGTYVDLDALTLKPLPTLTNWLTRVDDRLITSAVSSFTAGHPFLKEVTENIPKAFIPSSCCSIGPELFTERLTAMCPTNITIPTFVSPEDYEFCKDITIFPRKLFYPIHYGYRKNELVSIFTEGEGLGPAFFKGTEGYSLHLFHSLSNKRYVDMNSDSIIAEAARRNCPIIYSALKTKNRSL